jgi:hypothetical protein
MEGLLPNFSVGEDPHSGTCGMCHNPHSQLNKGETKKSCTDAACHADWRKNPFHTGPRTQEGRTVYPVPPTARGPSGRQ